jgi:hypothetical protein
VDNVARMKTWEKGELMLELGVLQRVKRFKYQVYSRRFWILRFIYLNRDFEFYFGNQFDCLIFISKA